MDPSFPPANPALANDRLISMLFLAGLFHGIVLLGVTFGGEGQKNSDALPTLEVLLVNSDLPEARANSEADYWAQRTQQGSGNMREPQRTKNPASSPVPLENTGAADGQALQERTAGDMRNRPDILAGLAAVADSVHLRESSTVNGGPPRTALLFQAGPLTSVSADDDGEHLVLKGKHQDELLVTPNTRESEIAAYLDGWRRKVERVGTVHFPLEVRRRGLSGSPVLEVAIRSDGVAEETIVRRSSGHAELDQAALAILKLASPFDPFPAELRERHRSIRFAYEWQFLAGELVDSSVQAPATL